MRGGIEGWRSRLWRRNDGWDGNDIRRLDCGHRRWWWVRSVERGRLGQLVMRNRGARVPLLHRHMLLAIVVLLVLRMAVGARHDAVLVVVAHVWLLVGVGVHAIVSLLGVRAVHVGRKLRGLGLGLNVLRCVVVLRLGWVGILLCPASASGLGILRRVQGSAAVGDGASSHIVCRLSPVAAVAAVASARHGW